MHAACKQLLHRTVFFEPLSTARCLQSLISFERRGCQSFMSVELLEKRQISGALRMSDSFLFQLYITAGSSGDHHAWHPQIPQSHAAVS